MTPLQTPTKQKFWTASAITNTVAAAICAAGLLAPPPYREFLLGIGTYALSGSITNWVAIYMLFERVPGLYGSGVIPARFTEFKAAIKSMLMSEFFHPEHVGRFIQEQAGPSLAGRIEGIRDRIDLERVYQGLVGAILESSFGGMLRMMGGASALEPLREPVKQKLAVILDDTIADLKADVAGDGDPDEGMAARLLPSIERIIDERLAELTPQMVKTIVEDMIRNHLGWLVVWGGVLGGVIGLVAAVVRGVV